VAGMADEDYRPSFRSVALDFGMDLGDEWAGRVDHAQAARRRMIPFTWGDAMGAEDHPLAFGYVVERLDENRAFPFQRFKHETVVNYLMANVERAAVLLEGAAHRLDRAIDAGTKAARFSQYYFLDYRFVRQH